MSELPQSVHSTKDEGKGRGAVKILIAVTGSIAAYKAADLASKLVQDGFDVDSLVTRKGLEFIGRSALEGITRKPLNTDMFEKPSEISHITLSDWADLVIVYPASADVIARLRTGRAEDLLSALFLANNFSSPWWIAPAMNSNMLAHPAVQENLQVLSAWGCRILPTEEGRMACGTTGSGKLLDPQQVRDFVSSWHNPGEQNAR